MQRDESSITGWLSAGLLALHYTARLVCRTVSDVPGGERNITGILVAGLSVLSSGMQQIFCRTMQQKHGLASHELLANTAPAQARHVCHKGCYPTP